MSRRGESRLEAFHLLLAHFAHCGMRNSLADNLNLAGTARFNLSICHKLRLSLLNDSNTNVQRKKMPAAWETIVPYHNHLELAWVNDLAIKAGCSKHVPFHSVEPLGKDTGERFFSEYLQWMGTTKPTYDDQDRCLCQDCGTKGVLVTAPSI